LRKAQKSFHESYKPIRNNPLAEKQRRKTIRVRRCWRDRGLRLICPVIGNEGRGISNRSGKGYRPPGIYQSALRGDGRIGRSRYHLNGKTGATGSSNPLRIGNSKDKLMRSSSHIATQKRWWRR